MKKIYKKDINKVMLILQALAKGKTIQFAVTDKEWIDLDSDEDGLSLETLINNPQAYRIKPEQKFRPFKDAEECWTEMEKHQPFGWVKHKKDGSRSLITSVIGYERKVYFDEDGWYFDRIMEHYTFADGAPFGVKEEE